MGKLSILVDQDETLIYFGARLVVRPHALEFIRFLKKITPDVSVLTAGLAGPQASILRATGLYREFKHYYGADNMLPQLDAAILIDNSPEAMDKLKYVQAAATGPVWSITVK